MLERSDGGCHRILLSEELKESELAMRLSGADIPSRECVVLKGLGVESVPVIFK